MLNEVICSPVTHTFRLIPCGGPLGASSETSSHRLGAVRQYIFISNTLSGVISVGQVMHLNFPLPVPLTILLSEFLLTTWPHTSNIGGLSLVEISLDTGQMKILWNLKSWPSSTSMGNSVLVIQSSLFLMMLATLASLGRANVLAYVVR